jgi:hypothetical protein
VAAFDEPAGVLPVAAGVELVLELQPAIASAAAAAPATAPSAADLFLSPTAGTPSARFCESELCRHTGVTAVGVETNWKLSYKIALLPDLNNGPPSWSWS